jgi:hypothetical protein
MTLRSYPDGRRLAVLGMESFSASPPDNSRLGIMRCAGDLHDARLLARSRRHEQRIEPRVGVDLQLAAIIGEVLLRIHPAPARGVLVPHRRRIAGLPWPSIAHIGPQPPALGLAAARGEHLHRSIIGVQVRCGEHVSPERRGQGTQQRTRCRNPLHERRAAERQARLGEDLALPIKRHVEAVLPRQDQREERGSGEALLDRARGSCRLHDPRALRAALLRADMARDGEGHRLHFQHLGFIGRAERLEGTAALGAAALFGFDHLLDALEVLREVLAPHRLLACGGGAVGLALGQRDRGALLK